ncbi:multiplied multi-transmembrane transporter-like protein [Babesia gibsoni]|uniref:Multiplied multi-transmembrane transporter-like protein n=1 Tax=Babesia gibsoni TaxID=33632 RepID=A0AAD8PDM9_BABGI|nr:multiplied multi-transmembrane transporter-like protein [Babesia gibsoni]
MGQNNEKPYKWYAIVLYHLVTFLEGFNLQCTPVCMRAFEMSLGLTASRLSVVFATELLSLLGIAAVWGYLVGKRQVKYICSLGMLICGIACILIGCTSGFPLVLVCRFLHGVGLSCVGPVYSKIITEQYGKEDQGSGNANGDQTSTWFSVANGAHCAGKVLSLMLVSVLATRNVIGQYGWRLCYCLTGYVWLMVAVVVFFFMTKTGGTGGDDTSSSDSSGTKKPYYTKPTFWLMACVMYTSETPFVMLGYMVMYFQYSGLSNKMAGVLGAVIQVAAVIGSCAGGYAATVCSKWEQEKGYGRFTFAMCVLAVRLFCITVLPSFSIEDGGLSWRQYVIPFTFGLTLFVASAVDRPTVTDISGNQGGFAGSLFRVVGGVPASATISPAIALLAEKFGYIESKELLEDMDIQTRMANVNALRMSLMCVGGVLTVLNILLYTPVFFTYGQDKGGGSGSQTGAASGCSNTSTGSGDSTSPGSKNVTYPWHAIVLYHVFALLDAYSTQSLCICMGAFEVDLGLSPSSLSAMATAHVLFELALSPIWGLLVDKKGCHLVESIAMLIMGHYGWRVSYCILGYAWLIAAPLVFYFMRPSSNASGSSQSSTDTIGKKLKCIFQVPSYWLLVAVYYASEASYAFMAYIPLYLQYSGLSEMAIACLCASVVFGGMFGGLFGGNLIDICHSASPQYGRLCFAAAALSVRLMYITSLMWWPIQTNGLTWEHYVEAFMVGATLVTIHSVDRPMLDDVVQKGSEGTALSFLRMIAGVPSSLLFPPLIGNLAERVYGYVKGAGFGDGADRVVMASNANALRRSIMYIMIGATAVNVALYVGLFFTYKKDKKGKDGQSGGTQSKCGGTETTSNAGGSGLAYPWPSVVLYHMVSFINAYDTQILSLSMRALEASLGLSASSLSIMASMEGMTLMGFAPVWGYLLTLLPCQYVCAAGMALCGISCILLAQVTTFSWILLIRLAHGIGLSCAAPVAVHIIAANWGKNKDGDKTKSDTNNSKDSMYSGINNGVVTLGKLTCFFLTGRYAGQKVFGHSGWRLSYALVGCVWLFAALPICLYMTKNGNTPSGGSGSGTSNNAGDQLKNIVGKPKFWVMTVLMFFSEAPYVIMGYMVMYLQYSGLSTVGIGSAIIVMQVGTAIGSVAGGVIAGKFNHWHSKYGRLSLATCALLIRLMYFVIFLWWPLNEHGLTWHRYCLLFVIGLTMLVSPTIEKPIVSDLDEKSASVTVPLYRAIGGMPSYFVFMPLLGWMAEKMYGYVKPSGDVSQLGHMVMSVNANALRKSMMWILSIATVLNIGLYVVVYYADQLGDALKPASCSASTASTGTGTLSCPYISKPKPYPWYAVLLYHIAGFMEGYNMQCTPVCMRALEMSLGVTASKLSFMYAVDLVSVLGIGAVWGYLLDTPLGKQKKKMEVQHVCCLGALVCGMGSILLGCTSSYPLILCSRFLQGGGLACVTQVCTKIIIEQWSVPPTEIQNCPKQASQTSLWFGLGFGVHCLGRVASLFLVGRIATWNVIGQYGWRLNYVLAGYVWLLLSVPVHCLMKKTITGAQHGSSSVDGAQFDPTNSSGRGEPQTAAVTVTSSTGTTSMTASATSSISISNAQGGVVGTSAPSTTPSTTKSESGGPENGTAAENGASVPSASTPLPQTAAPPEKNGEKPELATLLSNLIFCDGECFWSWNCSWLKKIGEWLRGTQKLVAVSLSGLTNLWHSIKKWLPFGGDASGGNNNQSTETSGAPSESVEVAPQPQTATSSGQGLSNGKEKRRQAMAKKTVEEAKKQLTEMCRSTGLSDFLCNHWWKSGVKLWSARSPKKKRQRRTTNGNSGKDGVPNEEGAMTQSTSTSEASGAASRSNGESATLQRQTYTSTTTTTTSSINFGSNGLGEQKKVEMTKTTKETPVEKGITSEGTHGFIHGSTISCTSNSSSNNGTAQPSCKGVYTYRSIPLNTLNDSESAKVSKLTPIPFYEKATFWLMKNSNVAYIIRVQHSINAMVSLNGHIWVYINCSVNTFNDVPLSIPLFRVILLYDYQMRSTH